MNYFHKMKNDLKGHIRPSSDPITTLTYLIMEYFPPCLIQGQLAFNQEHKWTGFTFTYVTKIKKMLKSDKQELDSP